jgi:RNA polymerase sigma-70 factor (ECF subfamily)
MACKIVRLQQLINMKFMNPGEEKFINDIKRREPEAIVLLFRSFYSPLCTYARGILKDKEDSKEIVQDVFIKIWDLGDELQISTSLKGYLYRCVHNRCLNHIRDNNRKKELSFSSLQQSESFISRMETPPDVFESLFSEDAEKSISEALKSLPGQCREVFLLCRFENLSYAEISVKMSISISTVKTQMYRAMKKLSESLKEDRKSVV